MKTSWIFVIPDISPIFTRDHIVLSDGEAVVHRIRQNCENDVDENNEEVMEWEKNRRKEAFARYRNYRQYVTYYWQLKDM